jgi:hypothetical protein
MKNQAEENEKWLLEIAKEKANSANEAQQLVARNLTTNVLDMMAMEGYWMGGFESILAFNAFCNFRHEPEKQQLYIDVQINILKKHLEKSLEKMKAEGRKQHN